MARKKRTAVAAIEGEEIFEEEFDEEEETPATPDLLQVTAVWAKPHDGYMLVVTEQGEYFLTKHYTKGERHFAIERTNLTTPPRFQWVFDQDFTRAIQEALWVCGILSTADLKDARRREVFFRRVMNIIVSNSEK